MTEQFRLYFFVFSLAIASLLISLKFGSITLSWQEIFSIKDTEQKMLLFELRLPRTMAAFTVGGLLALSGTLIQLLVQNPLADPYILGISSGAAFCTLLMMMLGMSDNSLIAGAWVGSLLTIFCILLLARKHRWHTNALLLCGVALSSALTAGISFILVTSEDHNLHSMLFWLIGDLNSAVFSWLSVLIFSFGLLACFLLAPGLNILSRGETGARALGLNSRKYRIILYLLSALFTATAVTIAGCVGFIGLIVPHLTRLLVGFDHRIVIPVAALLGGSLLTIADTLARTIIAPQQLPVGILLAFLGVPIFVWLLQK